MALVAALEPGLLQVPRAAQRAEHRAGQERVERLADPRAGRVLRGGDPDVVAAVVLDVEVPVEALRQGDLGQPALVLLLLVPELVGGVDADAGDHPDAQRQADLVHQRQAAPGDHPAGPHQGGVLDRQVEVGDPPVVPVVLQRLDHVVGRVAAVQAGQQVDDRDDAEDHDRPDPPPHAPAGQRVQPPGDERQGRHHQAEQPQVPLRVGPVLRGLRRDGRAGVQCGHGGHLQVGLQNHRECKPTWQGSPRGCG